MPYDSPDRYAPTRVTLNGEELPSLTDIARAIGVRKTATTTAAQAILKAAIADLRAGPLREAFGKLREREQEAVIERLGAAIDVEVAHVVMTLAAAGCPHVPVVLENATLKDGKVKANVVDRAALHALVDRMGDTCVLVLASPAEHLAAAKGVKADADQPGLDFEEPEQVQ